MPLFIKVGSIRGSRSSLSRSRTLMLLPESAAFSKIRTRRSPVSPFNRSRSHQLNEVESRSAEPVNFQNVAGGASVELFGHAPEGPLVFVNLIAAGRPRRTELQVHILVCRYIAIEADPAGESSPPRRVDLQTEGRPAPRAGSRAVSSARTSCADRDLQWTGQTQPSRISQAMPCASLRSGSTLNAFLTCRVSSSSTVSPASCRPADNHRNSGPASSPIPS
jgi:hypothetical protein